MNIFQIFKCASDVYDSMRALKIQTEKRKTLHQIHISYMRPILEYASVVWDGCSVKQQQLELIQ